MAVLRRELGEKFGMAGMPESGAVEHALGDRIGDDRAGPPRNHIADGLTNRGRGSFRAGTVGSPRLRRCRMTGAHNRQGVGKYTERIFSVSVGEIYLQAEGRCPLMEKVAIA